jgi:acetylornithine deacetylase
MDVVELTRKLIDIPSPTGEELAVGKFLASYLEQLGYQVTTQEIDPTRFNVFARTDARPRVVLSTHMDTVPPATPSREEGQRIFGRGACDAKGIIAAQIIAAELLRRVGIEEIGLLFTVDEEQTSEGAQVANKLNQDQFPEYLINGEPTDNKLAVATKGALRLRLLATGRAAHSAYPAQGESAIEKLLDVLQSIRKCDWPKNDVLGETTCNIGVIKGGTRPNVIADEAYADLQLRLVSEVEPVKRMIEEAVAGRVEIVYQSAHEPVFLEKVYGFDNCIVNFTTDIPYLSKWGRPLLLGPGSILNAHTEHEFVEKRELTEAVEIYVGLVKHLLAENSRTANAEATVT